MPEQDSIAVVQGKCGNSHLVIGLISDGSYKEVITCITRVALTQDGNQLYKYTTNPNREDKKEGLFSWELFSSKSGLYNMFQAWLLFSLKDLDKVSTAEIRIELIGSKLEPIIVPVNPYFIKEKKEGEKNGRAFSVHQL